MRSDHTRVDEPSIDKKSSEVGTKSSKGRSGGLTREQKRKPTYYMRKDEMTQLREEIVALRAKLQKVGSEPRIASESWKEATHRYSGLQNRVRAGSLAIASLQSLMASHGSRSRSPPIGGFIHLPRDPIGRQEMLTQLKMPRLHDAVQYALTRSQFLDKAARMRQIDTFETDTGDFVTTHWEITPLEECSVSASCGEMHARSVHDAYRELQYFAETQEISMSEKVGMMSIRESESDPVNGTQAVRMLSTHDNGVQAEMNLAIFSHYFEKSELIQQPHAVQVIDFVDQDDLYPRQPKNRLHNDAASVTLILETPSPSPGGFPLVTMVRWAFVRVNSNAYWERHQLEEVAREGLGKWCDVMLKCIRERLAWQA